MTSGTSSSDNIVSNDVGNRNNAQAWSFGFLSGCLACLGKLVSALLGLIAGGMLGDAYFVWYHGPDLSEITKHEPLKHSSWTYGGAMQGAIVAPLLFWIAWSAVWIIRSKRSSQVEM